MASTDLDKLLEEVKNYGEFYTVPIGTKFVSGKYGKQLVKAKAENIEDFIRRAWYEAEQAERKIWFENEKKIRLQERTRVKGLIEGMKTTTKLGGDTQGYFAALTDLLTKLEE